MQHEVLLMVFSTTQKTGEFGGIKPQTKSKSKFMTFRKRELCPQKYEDVLSWYYNIIIVQTNLGP